MGAELERAMLVYFYQIARIAALILLKSVLV
jgi:hypothetical protein